MTASQIPPTARHRVEPYFLIRKSHIDPLNNQRATLAVHKILCSMPANARQHVLRIAQGAAAGMSFDTVPYRTAQMYELCAPQGENKVLTMKKWESIISRPTSCELTDDSASAPGE